MKTAIVNGATGFIGNHLVKCLANNGVDVYALVRHSTSLFDGCDNIYIFNYDSENYNTILHNFDGINIDVFYNMAWSGVSTECKFDINKQIHNINLSLNAAEFAKDIKAKLFISSGTVAEYVFEKNVMNLEAKQSPNDFYGAAKVATHYFLDVFARKYNLPFIYTIIPSAYGEGRIDNNIITYTIRTLLNGEKPLYGNLEQMWDFLYVKEIARALMLIGENGHIGKTYGIGSGVYKPLKEYIVTTKNIVNPKLELGIGSLPELSNQTFSSCVNIDDLTKDTGFVPQIQFEEGIKRTIDWFKKETGKKIL